MECSMGRRLRRALRPWRCTDSVARRGTPVSEKKVYFCVTEEHTHLKPLRIRPGKAVPPQVKSRIGGACVLLSILIRS